MAITVTEQQGARSCSINNLYQATYKRVFVVETTGPALRCKQARDAAGVPAVGARYDDGVDIDNGSFVVGKQADEASPDGREWHVTVNYGPYDATTFPRDPTAWPLVVSWGAQRYERSLEKALDDDDEYTVDVVNSAGDPFSEPPTVDDNRITFTVERNERVLTLPADPIAGTPEVPGFDLDLIDLYRDKTNEDLWNGRDPGTVKCNAITPGKPQQSPDGWWYVPVAYQFEVREDGWDKVILDAGFAVVDGSGNLTQVKGKDGQPVHEPVPLDGNGGKLAHGDPAVYLTFKGYRRLPFAAFNIDLRNRLGLS